MRIKIISITAFVFVCAVCSDGTRIYLPREVQVEREEVLLRDISAIRSDNEFARQVGQVKLGKLSNSHQELTLSKAMITGRLIGSGIDVSEIEFTGAEKVAVSLRRSVIDSQKLINAALSYIKQQTKDARVCQYEPVGTVSDHILPEEAGRVEFLCRLVPTNLSDRVKVSVSIIADEQTVAVRDVEFRSKYFCREAVAISDIRAGEMITKDNTKIVQKVSNHREDDNWQMPYGKIASRDISAESVISLGIVQHVKSEIIVRRNKHVAVVFDRGGLTLTAVGKALEDGRSGDVVKVRMQISNASRVIYAKVKENGTLEPVI